MGAWFDALLTSGRVIDVALAAVVVELGVLLVIRRQTGLGPVDVIGQVLAGVLLLLAVRCAVTGAETGWILALLAASFPAHLFDLARRARASRRTN